MASQISLNFKWQYTHPFLVSLPSQVSQFLSNKPSQLIEHMTQHIKSPNSTMPGKPAEEERHKQNTGLEEHLLSSTSGPKIDKVAPLPIQDHGTTIVDSEQQNSNLEGQPGKSIAPRVSAGRSQGLSGEAKSKQVLDQGLAPTSQHTDPQSRSPELSAMPSTALQTSMSENLSKTVEQTSNGEAILQSQPGIASAQTKQKSTSQTVQDQFQARLGAAGQCVDLSNVSKPSNGATSIAPQGDFSNAFTPASLTATQPSPLLQTRVGASNNRFAENHQREETKNEPALAGAIQKQRALLPYQQLAAVQPETQGLANDSFAQRILNHAPAYPSQQLQRQSSLQSNSSLQMQHNRMNFYSLGARNHQNLPPAVLQSSSLIRDQQQQYQQNLQISHIIQAMSQVMAKQERQGTSRRRQLLLEHVMMQRQQRDDNNVSASQTQKPGNITNLPNGQRPNAGKTKKPVQNSNESKKAANPKNIINSMPSDVEAGSRNENSRTSQTSSQKQLKLAGAKRKNSTDLSVGGSGVQKKSPKTFSKQPVPPNVQFAGHQIASVDPSFCCFNRFCEHTQKAILENALDKLKLKPVTLENKQKAKFCKECHKLWTDGMRCLFCNQVYHDSIKDNKIWIMCSGCEKWQHTECELERNNKEDEDMREVCLDLKNSLENNDDDSDDGPEYWCRSCRREPAIRQKRNEAKQRKKRDKHEQSVVQTQVTAKEECIVQQQQRQETSIDQLSPEQKSQAINMASEAEVEIEADLNAQVEVETPKNQQERGSITDSKSPDCQQGTKQVMQKQQQSSRVINNANKSALSNGTRSQQNTVNKRNEKASAKSKQPMPNGSQAQEKPVSALAEKNNNRLVPKKTTTNSSKGKGGQSPVDNQELTNSPKQIADLDGANQSPEAAPAQKVVV